MEEDEDRNTREVAKRIREMDDGSLEEILDEVDRINSEREINARELYAEFVDDDSYAGEDEFEGETGDTLWDEL